MKAVLHVPSTLTEWFEEGAAPEVLRSGNFALVRSAIIQCKSSREKLERDLLSARVSDATKRYLEAILQLGVFDKRDAPKNVDFQVDASQGFANINQNLVNEINELSTTRTESYKSGESRESLYKRTLGVPASLAKSVIVLDPYAGTAICDKDVDRLWLLRRIRKSGCREIQIVTTIPDGRNKSVGHLSPSNRQLSITAGLQKLASELDASISARIFRPNSRLFHNRRIKFEFLDGTFGCLLEKGIDGFASNSIEPGSAVLPVSQADFSEAIKVTNHLRRV
jgi:hypothetical protein